MRVVDLRSDTITKPTPAMRKAMAEAEVGDDVFGEDPTVNRLEKMAAELLGKEDALFVSSGTMGNLVSLLAHCNRGDEMILGDMAHNFLYEQGGSAGLGGIHPRIIRNQPDGTLDLSEIEAAIRPDNIHFPRTRLISLENTHNRCSGNPLGKAYMQSVGKIADQYELKVHVDGARIFNAATALNLDARELVTEADSVTFCLSKALAAPAGSVVCGNSNFIEEARRARKVLGGGMRQAGVLAAAGIVAITEMIGRLGEDHANARKLAGGLRNLTGIDVDENRVKTNIVYLNITSRDLTAEEVSNKLDAEGVRLLATAPKQLRAVTNYHIETDDIEYTLGVFSEILKSAWG